MNRGGKQANDKRYRIVDAYDDLIAIANTVSEYHRIIELNVTNANPRDIGENLDNIEQQVRFANIALHSLRGNLQRLRDGIREDIRGEYGDGEE